MEDVEPHALDYVLEHVLENVLVVLILVKDVAGVVQENVKTDALLDVATAAVVDVDLGAVVVLVVLDVEETVLVGARKVVQTDVDQIVKAAATVRALEVV